MTMNQVKNELPESPPFLPFFCPPCFVSLRAPGLLPPPLLELLLLPPPLAFLRGAIARTAAAGESCGLRQCGDTRAAGPLTGAGAAAGAGRISCSSSRISAQPAAPPRTLPTCRLRAPGPGVRGTYDCLCRRERAPYRSLATPLPCGARLLLLAGGRLSDGGRPITRASIRGRILPRFPPLADLGLF